MPSRSHGDTGTRLYMAWQNMRARCNRKSAREYENYGGRGISVCDEWQKNYEPFKEWALSNGYSDELTLDRIDVDKGYSPDNCRWITNKEQQNNRRDNVLHTFNGETKTLAQWSEELGICYKTLQKRIGKWGVEKAFSTPLKTESVIDITGKKFGRLKAVSLVSTKGGTKFECVCDCGRKTIQRGYDLRKGIVVSCGCYQREKASIRCKELGKASEKRIKIKEIRAYTKSGEFVAEYNGVKNASEMIGISESMIYRALNDENFTAKGMKWRVASC